MPFMLKGHTYRIFKVHWDKNNVCLYSSSLEGKIILWDIFN